MATRIGEHEFEIDPPDVVIMRWRGALTPTEFSRGIEYLRGKCSDWPHMLLLADLSGVTTIPADVRRIVPELTSWMPFRGVVITGASFTIRTVAVMLFKVINLVRGADNPTHYASSEEDARQWLAQRRRELAEAGGGDR